MLAVLTASEASRRPTNPRILLPEMWEAARQGGVLFNVMNCDGCHGAGGLGFVGPSLVDTPLALRRR